MSSPAGSWDMALIELFRSEIETHSESLNAALLALERAPADTSRIDEMMRAAHSIKGAARVVGVDPAVHVAHVMEDCFVAAQKGTLRLTPADVDVLLRGVDLLGNISAATRDPEANLSAAFDGDVQSLVGQLENVLAGKPAVATPPVAIPPAAATLVFPSLLDGAAAEALRQQFIAAMDAQSPAIRFDLSATKDLEVPGLALLAAAPQYIAARSGPPLSLAGVSSEMATVLRVTGLENQYRSSDTVPRGTP
ncbi:MAG: Hpt domain-containing protein [Planctomycetia bacterium]|nr:Hpt domain-containing protein [Planctomycetia bacterium]